VPPFSDFRDEARTWKTYKNKLVFIIKLIHMKFNAFVVAGLLLFTSLISVAVGQEPNSNTNCESCENADRYELFNKTYFVFGKIAVSETFTTPMDCREVYAERIPGKFFTGIIHILISDEVPPMNHTVADSSLYLFGIPIWPGGGYFNEDWFTPGKQELLVRAEGFGTFTIRITGE